MQKILLVNDDGYKAAGIRALQQELSKTFEVTAVAPAHEQSWMGKSITGHRELRLEPVEYHGFKGYSLDGTPADCTQIGMYELLHGKPDFVVSGINQGANIGHAHVLSSGTVGAALEAAIQGIPAFAISVWKAKRGNPGIDFEAPDSVDIFKVHAEIAVKLVQKIMNAGFPMNAQVIGVNLPYDVKPDAPWTVTQPHREPYGRLFTGKNGKFKHAAYVEPETIDDETTDLAALIKGHVSIVPISIELTSEAGQQALADILDSPIST